MLCCLLEIVEDYYIVFNFMEPLDYFLLSMQHNHILRISMLSLLFRILWYQESWRMDFKNKE